MNYRPVKTNQVLMLSSVLLDFRTVIPQHNGPTKSRGSTYLDTESDESGPGIVFFPPVTEGSRGHFWIARVVLQKKLSSISKRKERKGC